MKKKTTKISVTNSSIIQKLESSHSQKPKKVACFVCDGTVTGKGIPLLMTYTPYSKTDLATKIGQFMGDGFMVIVAVTDVLCKRCAALINHLDKLENDTSNVKNVLIDFLKMKYQLNEVDLEYTPYDEYPESLNLQDHTKPVFTAGEENKIKAVDEDVLEDLKCGLIKDVKPENFKSEDRNGANGKREVTQIEYSQNSVESTDHLECSESSAVPSISFYECNTCSFSSTDFDSLMDHLRSHPNHKSYKCECYRKFEALECAEHHVQEFHDSSNNFKKDMKELENDPDYCPIQQKIFECKKCKYHHHNKRLLEVHMQKHSKCEKFNCHICSRCFRHRKALKKHLISHKLTNGNSCDVKFENELDFSDYEAHSTDSKAEHSSDINRLRTVISKYVIEKDSASDFSESCAEFLNFKQSGTNTDVLESQTQNQEMREEYELQEKSEKEKSQIYLGKNQSNNSKIQSLEHNSIEESSCVHDTLVVKKKTEKSSCRLIEERNDFHKEEDEESCSYEILTILGGEVDKLENIDTSENNYSEFQKKLKMYKTEEEKFTSVKVYVCSLCQLKTTSEAHIKRHFRSHVAIERKIYKCSICDKAFTTRSNLKRHIILHENCLSGEMECNMCNEVVTDRLHLKHHMEAKHPELYQCSFCDRRFESKKVCHKHELTHPSQQCDMCHKLFLTEGRLKSHKIFIHGKTEEYLKNCTTKSKHNARNFKCHICQRMLTTFHNLKRHLRNHEKCTGAVSCVLCNIQLTDKLHLRQHIEEKHPEKHQCTFCPKIFTNRKTCNAHELTHPERCVYKCESCEKMFLTEVRMKRHKEVMHRDPYCRHCGKEIVNPLKLLDHEKRHKKNKMMYSCDHCPKVFQTRAGLKYHSSVHTGKYAVYCEICGKGLHSEVVLEEHKATHTKEVRYTCEKCGRTFSSKSTYRLHRLWHDNPLPYKCNICDRKFKHTSILAVHKRRVHTGERPYKCPHCSQTFSVSSTLNRHVILHTKEYPYHCKLCEKGFTTRTKLARHMGKIHNDFEMLRCQKQKCEYKMALHPSEIAGAQTEEKECLINAQKTSPQSDLLEDLEKDVVNATQAAQAVFTDFQQEFTNSQFNIPPKIQ